jgi:transcriptional regulator with XRE-family HTH domain
MGVKTMSDFPSKLKEKRLEKNLSQQTVANSVGISQQAYGLYERGKREPNLDTLVKLANFLGTSIDVLVGRLIEVTTSSNQAQIEKAKELYNAPTNSILAKKMFHQAFVAGVADVQGREAPIVYPEFEEVVKNPDLYKNSE